MSMVVPKRGSVTFQGQNVTGWPSHAIARKGMSLVPRAGEFFRRSASSITSVPISASHVDRGER